MDAKFIECGQGFLRKNLSDKFAYTSFVPTPLQKLAKPEITEELLTLLTACSRRLGEFNAMLSLIPNVDMYISMYLRKEALLSAQIEGTQCTFDDIFDSALDKLKQNDVAEVLSYVKAAHFAQEKFKELPLSLRFFKEVHKELLNNARGQEKSPGQVRSTQNWIGPQGCTLNEAAFVPPNISDMYDALSDLDHFINDETDMDPLIRAALIHYQFETIHPFLDGNGRLGRLLITLCLMNDGVLTGPVFYPSYQLKLNRSEYYQQLMNVRLKGSYDEWILFFCRCILQSAEDAIDSMHLLIQLSKKHDELIKSNLGQSYKNASALLEHLQNNPITNSGIAAEAIGTTRTTATSLLNSFVDLEILQVKNPEAKRYKEYVYESYLEILRVGADPITK